MKKLLLIVTILTSSLWSNAQEGKMVTGTQAAPDAATRAKNTTERMNTAVTLTADQKTKVLAINLEKATAMDANRKKSGDNKEAYEKEKQNILNKWNKDLGSVLTADQMSKWKTYMADQQKNSAQKSE